jgi:RCC1 and BTB domain-containing protein
VFSYGINSNGCLGLGHNNAVNEPQVVNELRDKQVIDIKSGGEHVLVLTKCGQCYSCGYNNYGQLGIETTDQSNQFKRIYGLNDKHIIGMSCGLNHSLVLLESGEVYAFGYNGSGELGLDNNVNQSIPSLVNGFNSEKVKAISCGSNHSLALTESGLLFSWGANSYYQLGLTGHQSIPSKVNFTDGVIIKKIVCGPNHSLILTNMGKIYAFGYNASGQIGNGDQNNQSIPIRININAKIVDISSGISNNISIAKSENGNCYVWGECRNDCVISPKETRFESMFEIYSIYAKIAITQELLSLEEKPVVNRLIESISGLFDDQKDSDFKFKFKVKEIFVHKLILKTRCEHFRKMFSNDWNENKTNEIEIPDYSYDVYYAFLKYLYSGSVVIKPEEAIDLLDLANSYLEEELKEKCVNLIKNELNVENFCVIYSAAVKYESKELENFCIEFASNNLNNICKSDGFKQMDKNSMCKLFIRSAENNFF